MAAVGILAIQAAAVATVTVIDDMRKRREPQSGVFPHLPPQDVTVGNNSFDVYTYGQDLYDAMLKDINEAKDSIFFESFIVKADETGYQFRDALIAAAKRGVEVHIILDTWGNLNQNPRFRHFPKLPNLHSINFPLVRTGILTGRERDKGRDHRQDHDRRFAHRLRGRVQHRQPLRRSVARYPPAGGGACFSAAQEFLHHHVERVPPAG